MKTCKVCLKEKDISEFSKHRRSCKLCEKERKRKNYLENQERYKNTQREWRRNNLEYSSNYFKENRKRLNQNRSHLIFRDRAIRDFHKRGQPRPGDYDLSPMVKKYRLAHIMNLISGKEYQIDHIIPIRHKNVCGLHRHWNMQVITKEENKRKFNKFDGTYENQQGVTHR